MIVVMAISGYNYAACVRYLAVQSTLSGRRGLSRLARPPYQRRRAPLVLMVDDANPAGLLALDEMPTHLPPWKLQGFRDLFRSNAGVLQDELGDGVHLLVRRALVFLLAPVGSSKPDTADPADD